MVRQKPKEIMSSRDAILQAVKANQPGGRTLPGVNQPDYAVSIDPLTRFSEVLTAIGGRVILVDAEDDLKALIRQAFGSEASIRSVVESLPFEPLFTPGETDPHLLQDVEVALMTAQFGVAENGAVWVTEENYQQVRVLPFICQHLGIVLSRTHLVPYMHNAYARIGDEKYGFGLFIAGPSKTADIEQSLVLGAHGPKTMTVFLTP
jgi:L-lactate dehydrogenase complex protein LldG